MARVAPGGAWSLDGRFSAWSLECVWRIDGACGAVRRVEFGWPERRVEFGVYLEV